MLSTKTMEIIKQTAPILQNYGQEITTHFYNTMLDRHPELLNIFNISHQRDGRQPRALAEALLAVAMYADNLEMIRPAVLRIATSTAVSVSCQNIIPLSGNI